MTTHPRTLADIPTPALLLDVPAMERNIRRMADFFSDGPCKLRPHFKAHKTTVVIVCLSTAGGIPKHPQPQVSVGPHGIEGDYHPQLPKRAYGRRGIVAVVRKTGELKPGDSVEIVP